MLKLLKPIWIGREGGSTKNPDVNKFGLNVTYRDIFYEYNERK